MTQPSTVLSIFAMFLHTTFGESGCTSADGDGTLGDDEPDNFDIDCFSQLEIKDSFSSLTCNFTELPPYNTNYTLSLCTKEDNNYACSNMKKQEDAFFLQFNDILSNRDVCMYSETKRRVCRSLVVTDIVKPEVPFAINITYEREANEYLIRYCTPHSRKKYLKDKLVHQVAYRQKEGTWKTIESPYLQIKLLGRNLESEASYEVKVRSQPDGDYFKGTWSEWSTSKSFKTKREHDSMESYSTVAMIIFSILGFILSIVMIALIVIFWENRIKPAVWPNLPDHKKTLEQLCRKPKNPSTAPETSIQEKFRSGSDLKVIPAMADKNNLNPPMSYGGVWPAEALHRLLGTNQFAVTEGSCSSSTYEVCHSNRVPLHNDGFNLFSTPSLDPSGQTHPEPLNDDTISQMLPNSDMRSPNNEEAYVTMSNFYKIQ
ncbi:interleukin-7 receptor subunit alpha isoform X2 [Corvus kubaryi]|uniref:interleukin-7 receptor subunit alpha isoform X2 n=1 Tax=Corvus kubaryi TaxID=68294 RepID=UPI001C044E39|nr:interleukin-7 receptor subunit alpha isoform X2 [Corvus kubaryi]